MGLERPQVQQCDVAKVIGQTLRRIVQMLPSSRTIFISFGWNIVFIWLIDTGIYLPVFVLSVIEL